MQTVFRRASLVVGLLAALSVPAPSAIAAPALPAIDGVVRLIAPGGAAAPFPAAHLVRALPGGTVAIDVPAARAADAFAQLSRRYGPGRVRPDGIARLADERAATDPYWPDMWGAKKIGMPAAWAVSIGSPDVVIAIVDSGVNAAADLTGAVLPGTDIVNGDADPADDAGHGTEVAQVAAARIDNGSGGAGICPRCSILPVKVAGPDGFGWTSDIDTGIVWAVDHGATVVNVSLGSTGGAGMDGPAVRYARSAGVSVVASAGNDADTVPHYPAASAGVIAVAATDEADRIESWSTRGPWVELAAPGAASVVDAAGQGWDVSGTSYAAPMVSGALALLASAAPGSTMAQREAALLSTAVPASPAGSIGGGRIDVSAALAAILAGTQPSPPTPPKAGAPVIAVTAPAHAVTYTRAPTVDLAWTETLVAGESVGARTATEESTPVVEGICDGSAWTAAAEPSAPEAPSLRSGPLADATCHRWRVHVVDHSGRAGDGVSGIVFVDRRKPTVRAVLPKRLTRTSASTITFRWTVADGSAGSGVTKTRIVTEKGRQSGSGCAGWSRAETHTYAYPMTEDQYQVWGPICVRLRVTALDAAGNSTTVVLPAYRHG